MIENIEKLSKVQRILICVGTLLVLIGGFVYFSYLPKYTKVDQLNKDIENLEQKIIVARGKARKLKKYREDMKKAEVEFKVAKKALPEKREIPSLLTSISQSGRDAGLDFLLFQPGAEVKKDFYAEIPVSIKVTGSYHNVAIFFDKVARLFRIVNLADIKMTSGGESGILSTSCTAITYRFVEPAPPKKPEKKS